LIQTNKIIKAFSWVVLANIITKPLWMLLFIYAARVLGSEQYGIFTFASSVVSIFIIFIDSGFDYISTREISRDQNKLNYYFNIILSIRTFIFLVSFSGVIIWFTLNPTIQVNAILLLLVLQLLTVLLAFLKSIISSIQMFSLFSKMLVFEKILITVVGFTALLLNPDVIFFIQSLIFSSLISFILFFILFYTKLKISFRLPQLVGVKKILKDAIPLIIISLFIILYFRVDVLILEHFVRNKEIIGVYGAIHRLLEMYQLIPVIIMSVAYPIIARNFEQNKHFTTEFINGLFKLFLLISIPLAVVVSFFSLNFISFLFGDEYIIGAEGLKYMIWAIIPLGINYFFGNLMVTVKKEKYSAGIVGVSAAFNVIMNIIFIPVYSFVAASVIAFLTEMLIFLLNTYFVSKFYGFVQIKVLILKALTAIVIILLMNLLFDYLNLNIHLFLDIILYLSVTFILLAALGIFRIKDIRKVIRSFNE
jgi:O-antigen/teichoic acid export membrane protein